MAIPLCLVAASILAARKLGQIDGVKRVPATISAIADEVGTEEIMKAIDDAVRRLDKAGALCHSDGTPSRTLCARQDLKWLSLSLRCRESHDRCRRGPVTSAGVLRRADPLEVRNRSVHFIATAAAHKLRIARDSAQTGTMASESKSIGFETLSDTTLPKSAARLVLRRLRRICSNPFGTKTASS
jgi:hypothetical protein